MYSSLDDIKAGLPEASLAEITDDTLGSLAIKEDIVTQAIEMSDSEIDSYLIGRYDVPLATVPDVIKRCSVDITIYSLFKRRVEEMPDLWRNAYKDALRILESIRDGKMSLAIIQTNADFLSGAVITPEVSG